MGLLEAGRARRSKSSVLKSADVVDFRTPAFREEFERPEAGML